MEMLKCSPFDISTRIGGLLKEYSYIKKGTTATAKREFKDLGNSTCKKAQMLQKHHNKQHKISREGIWDKIHIAAGQGKYRFDTEPDPYS